MREILQPELSQRTTLRLGGTAIAELIVESEEDCNALPERIHSLGGRPLILGAGSNILACNGRLPLVLVRPVFTNGPEIVADDGDKVFVRVGAGLPLPRLLRFCQEHALSGLEGLVGIPGSVGGAVAMNAGSFGVETCEKLASIHVLIEGSLQRVNADALQYGYRRLSIAGKKDESIVVEATFSLTRGTRDGITSCMRHNFLKKKSRQPVTSWSAGCVFKNPAPDMPAGKLLDLAGFKGKKRGGMAFSAMHANFLINEGNGDADAALSLLHDAREAVQQRFDIELEPEVRIVPWRSF